MPKKKTLTETAVETAVETIAGLAGADNKKPAAKRKSAAKNDPSEIVAEKLVETVASIVEATTDGKEAAAPKKPAAKKAAKPAAKKTAAKKPAAKDSKTAAAKKSEPKAAAKKSALPIEYQCKGGNYTGEEIIEKCKAAYRGDSRKQVRSIQVYVKGSKAYFVVNGQDKDENGAPYSISL
ncbi:MAG: DUF6465 family protein [Oscillospiraceae bacterium]|nr:DUF6465 family protein [Oscillospiraceae bacterium]